MRCAPASRGRSGPPAPACGRPRAPSRPPSSAGAARRATGCTGTARGRFVFVRPLRARPRVVARRDEEPPERLRGGVPVAPAARGAPRRCASRRGTPSRTARAGPPARAGRRAAPATSPAVNFRAGAPGRVLVELRRQVAPLQHDGVPARAARRPRPRRRPGAASGTRAARSPAARRRRAGSAWLRELAHERADLRRAQPAAGIAPSTGYYVLAQPRRLVLRGALPARRAAPRSTARTSASVGARRSGRRLAGVDLAEDRFEQRSRACASCSGAKPVGTCCRAPSSSRYQSHRNGPVLPPVHVAALPALRITTPSRATGPQDCAGAGLEVDWRRPGAAPRRQGRRAARRPRAPPRR